jgi:hypothetical protein
MDPSEITGARDGFTSVVAADPNVILHLTGIAGRSYQLRTSIRVSGPWADLGAPLTDQAVGWVIKPTSA